ncbi:C40 family peptidase [Actinoplanes awajinensis]|uniref:C40 family peptidase n=1 Tax=Actinoplanes awajinensis TaxID=135946 RepID=UPI001E3442C2|nr:C40 family peptidase [Actinoplanes awajinensis]
MQARLRPVMYSAAAAATLAALFQPIPAMAAPTVPAGGQVTTPVGGQPTAPGLPAGGQVIAAGVPDAGSRPTALGALVLPGTPISTTTTSAIPGSATSPVLQQIEKGRIAVDQLGDQLLKLKAERDLAQTQVTTALQKVTDAQTNLGDAQTDAVAAAGLAMQQAAAAPPGALDSGLLGLDQLARLQRGETPTDDSSASRLEAAQIGTQIALDEQITTTAKWNDLAAQYTKMNAQLVRKQAAQQKLENAHRAELTAAESAASAADQALGTDYLSGSTNGQGADPRAVQALQYALAQRGDPYVWSEEGPDQFDCSGLMYAAYHTVNFPLVRVSRDQYWQTRNKVVDRYSLLPGDLLFFSYSNSWTGIHHVAMYAGDGMMVEAPRTGLNVRLVPVRWTRLFQATRVFGSVEGGASEVPLGSPDAEEPATGTPTKTATPKPSATTKTPSPSTSSTSKPPVTTSPTPKPSGSSSSPSANPSTTTPSTQPSATTPSSTPSATPSKTPDPVETTTSAPEATTTSASAAQTTSKTAEATKSTEAETSTAASVSTSSD